MNTLNRLSPTYANRPMWQLFYYLQTYKLHFWLSVIFSILNKILDLMPPLLVGWVVATVTGHAPAWTNRFVDTHNIWHVAIFLASLVIIIFALESLTEWACNYGFMSLTQYAQHDLRLAAYQHIQNREMAFFEKHRVGETMSMVNDDVNQLERFLNTGLVDLLQLATLIVFSAYVLFSNSWQLALMGVAPIPIIIWGSFWFQRRIGPRYKKVREAVGELATRLENNFSGIAVIKSFTAEDFETQRLAAASNKYSQANFMAIKYTAMFEPLIRMAVAVGFAGILLIGSYWVLKGNTQTNVSQLVIFSMLIQRLLWPLTRLGATLDDFERARASARRIFGILNIKPEIQDPIAPKALTQVRGEITFEDVYFAYDNKVPVLNGLNFTIRPGEMVGIAGHTGAGKSTLIKLLLRFYDVTGGSLKIDGIDTRELKLNDLRRHIALVSQDVYLFHGTIAENIAYSLPEISQEKIIQAASLAHMHEFIMSLPEGYNTIVGERGIKLSGGQRQRLSLARAILKNAPILILDEATSAVDTETEREIQLNLSKFAAGKTALIIAHRLSTIREADRILVLRDGKLVEQGHHDDLLALQGSYADLWNVQTGVIQTAALNA